jgi:protocatechuate 3,4-dioxygenase beta subunit
MTAQGAGRPSGRRAAVVSTARAGLRHGAGRTALALLVAAVGSSTAAIAGAPALASGERSGESGGATGETTATSSCPAPNPPNQLTLVAGTPQTAALATAFGSGLQVALTNSDGCAVTGAAGLPVTFSAPASGASGIFSASNSNTVTVGADASGTVAAPTFAANGTAGSYTVTAISQYGSVSFSLANTAAGIPARIVAIPLENRSARVTAGFPQPLQVRVLDAGGNPVAGATVTFTLGGAGASACDAAAAASASFADGGTQATVTSDANGLATSPSFTANTATGTFTATAAFSGGDVGGSENPGKGGGSTLPPVSFSLSNLAGNPAKLTTGVGSTQATPTGRAFPIRLAVTVTDQEKNPVPGALITFSAPVAGASGRFTVHSRSSRRHRAQVSHPHTVKVETDACGIAVAPTFTASHTPGGYVVKATVEHARPAAFALVNEAPGQSR